MTKDFWQGRRDSNTQPAVLETAALPLSHSPKGIPIINDFGCFVNLLEELCNINLDSSA